MKATRQILTFALALSALSLSADSDQIFGARERNPEKNQMHVYLKSGDIKYYDTEFIDRLLFDGENLTVRHSAQFSYPADVFTASVSKLEFRKGRTECDFGTFTNPEGAVRILEARGWQEMAYIRWEPFAGADDYNVYVKGGQYADYQKIDAQLVRNYGAYGRADIPGLTPGSYAVKIVPVKDGAELASANEATAISVSAFDRNGFAHFGGCSVGAYENNGTLKKGAQVLYITNDTFNTCAMTLTTSSKGATTLCTGLGEIFKAKQKGYDTTPICVRIIGMIDVAKIGTSQLLSDQDGLLLKGNGTDIDFQTTIEGIGEDACLKGFGLGFFDGRGAEVRNLAIMLHGSSNDNLEIKGTQHIWVHNNDFFYGQQGGGDHAKGDGSLDTKDECTYATLSYNHFWDCGKCNLCGMKSETVENLLVYHHNWFDHSDSRHPRVRTSTVHLYNNYYDGVAKYGVGATMGCSIFVENNYFRGCVRPMMSSRQGTDATGEGTFSGEDGGIIKSFNNIFAEKPSKFSYITWQKNPTSFDAYEATARDEQIPSTVVTLAGSTSYNNFDTSAKMFEYTPDATADVPAIVTGYARGAGRLNHGDIRYAFNNATDDSDYGRLAGLDAVLANYKPTLVGFFSADLNNPGTNPGTGDDQKEDDPKQDDPGQDTPEGTIVCDFLNNAPSSSLFTVTGNYSNSKGTATYNGTAYGNCLKLESATSVKFTLTEAKKMILVFADTETGSIKIDGTKQTSTGSTLEQQLEAGAHELTKADTRNLFLIILE